MRISKFMLIGGFLGFVSGIIFALVDSSGSGNSEPVVIAFFTILFVVFGALCGMGYAVATRSRVEANVIARKKEERRKQPPKGPELAIGVVAVMGIAGVVVQTNKMLNAPSANETDWLNVGLMIGWILSSLLIIKILLLSHTKAMQKFSAAKSGEVSDDESTSIPRSH